MSVRWSGEFDVVEDECQPGSDDHVTTMFPRAPLGGGNGTIDGAISAAFHGFLQNGCNTLYEDTIEEIDYPSNRK
ncbi:unnamed protein product [Mesocestoides corti]|uniref:Uncharacterized protein n=1 Tax=Mesocestoides corti TaxID=53468 RepID=A0A0R3U4Z8_MESCO|nr:unnamed protein product [Mesocestoides corti]